MEKKIIKLAIQHDLFNLLNKSACQMCLNEMLVNKELTVYEGKFYLTGDSEGMSLEDCVEDIVKIFSYTRTGVKGWNGDKKLITRKLKRFKLETSLSYEEILKVADYYVENYPSISGYLVMAKYFFYKQDRRKEETSWAKGILELWKEAKEEQESFNTNMDD
jgi:hypothetical protein